MLGLPIAEVIGANIFRWVHDDDVLTIQGELRDSGSRSPACR